MGERIDDAGRSGKLTPEELTSSVLSLHGADRGEVLIGPAVGEDAAVIEWPSGKYMVFASDPISGAAAGAGRLLVRVNVNDIASKGGEPAYMTVTLIVPPSMGSEGVRSLMEEIHEECAACGVAIVGGHTEFCASYDRPVLSAALVGTADRVFRASDIRVGDAIFVTKHIGIEGMAILANDRPDLLSGVLSDAEIESVRGWMDQTSVLDDARVLRRYASFMHDPTEGGFFGGLGEICELSGLDAEIDVQSVPLHDHTLRASRALGFDPLHLVASGSLLAIVPDEAADDAERSIASCGIAISRVGYIRRRLGASSSLDTKEELWGLLARPRRG